MNSINILTKIYKPYKITVKGSVKIFNSSNGNYVIKEKKNKDIKELYKYLSSRSFISFPKLIEDSRDGINVFEYIEDTSIDNEQKLLDLVNVISLLHNKTCYYKEVTNDKIKSIYEELLGRVNFMEEYFNTMIYNIEDNVFVSPANNLILNNSSKIFDSLTFLKSEIEEWYKISVDLNKIRVCLIHNNLDLEHYIKNSEDYLISWDNYKIDSPILDIVKLYKKVYLDMNFSEALSIYMDNFRLNDSEKKLLCIMLVLPDEINLSTNELKNVSVIRKYLDYIYKTEDLIKPFYSL